MTFQHLVLWIDHHEARLFGLKPNLVQVNRLRNDRHHFHKDHDSLGSRRERDRPYFVAVCEALGESPEILLLGPGTARNEFLSYMQEHHPDRVKHVLGNQACDDIGDEALAEKGCRFFHATDRMQTAR